MSGPGPTVQQQRLGRALQRLTAAFEQQRLGIEADPHALEAEQILVLEIAGEIDEFARAVRRIPGLEFLAEEIEDKVDPDDFAAIDAQGRRGRYDRQLFLVASDQTAWHQLLSLWELFQRGDTFPYGLTPFRNMFELLRVLRPWDDRDRLERTGAIAAWERELVGVEDELVDFELELWLRSDPRRRSAILTELRADLTAVGGELVYDLVHEEISYHGVLGRAPARRLLEAVSQHEVRWLRTGAVRFFHPAGQMAAPPLLDDAEPETAALPTQPRLAGEPKLAILDGLPLAGHNALEGRLIIDDPDDWAQTIPATRRVHGTGTASVVVHGDLNGGSDPLRSPVYARPILTADAPAWVSGAREELPRDRLAVDVIHGAVARLFEGEAPAAPAVRVIVLPIGDTAQQFDRFISPLARLLDWLSYRYEVLFLVSAGNHLSDLEVPANIGTDDPQELQEEILCAIVRSSAIRRLLSPAESINALTIGAAHADHSAQLSADDRLEPIVTPDLPAVGTALGGGVRRAVKPDVLLPGGRQLVRLEPVRDDGVRLVSIPPTRKPPGVRMAAPGGELGRLDSIVHATGTSVATATAGHHAGHLFDEFELLRELHGEAMPPADLEAVLIKAALVHTARWGSARAFLEHAHHALGQQRSRDAFARLVGYGRASPERAFVCDEHRVTVIGGGRIARDDAHAYSFPLPPSLSARTDRRRVHLTLAWLTPVNPGHRFYRRAALKLEPGGHADVLGEGTDATVNGARRGTVQHEVLEGTRAVPYAPGSTVELTVSCRADAGALEAAVPYALIVTVETPVAAALPIYEEVRQALRVPVAVRAART